jgi:hypothetical protein
MYIRAYDSWADESTKEQLWLCAEWVSAGRAGPTRFYIREDRLSFAHLIDSQLVPRPKDDYIL